MKRIIKKLARKTVVITPNEEFTYAAREESYTLFGKVVHVERRVIFNEVK